MRYGRGEFFLIHRAVTDNNNLVEHGGVFLKNHIDSGAPVNGHCLGCEPYIGKPKFPFRINAYNVVAVDIGGRSTLRINRHHTGAYNRLA